MPKQDPLASFIDDALDALRPPVGTPAERWREVAAQNAEAWLAEAEAGRVDRATARANAAAWLAFGEQQAQEAEAADAAMLDAINTPAWLWAEAARELGEADGTRPPLAAELEALARGERPGTLPDHVKRPGLEDVMHTRPDLAAKAIEASFESVVGRPGFASAEQLAEYRKRDANRRREWTPIGEPDEPDEDEADGDGDERDLGLDAARAAWVARGGASEGAE